MARAIDELRFEPATAAHLDDLDQLLASGDPRSCQCAFYRLTNRDYKDSSPANNRLVHHQVIIDAEAVSRAAGLLAYNESTPVGWVSFGPREDFARLETSVIMAPIDDQPVWSVICFVVPAGSRRQGVATRLLDATIQYARERDVPMLEAYPVDHRGRKIGSSQLYKGTLTMFEAAGFSIAGMRQASATSAPRPTVRMRP